ncbi:MAG: hypothetical protein AAGC55_19905 [Myxococcota bacterium]
MAPALLWSQPAVHASAIIIRDVRVQDTSVTPALGRGYALASNTYHSVCFNKVQETRPSFDSKFVLERIEFDRNGSLKRNLINGHASHAFLEGATQERALVVNGRIIYRHFLLASLTVTSYYSSINEAEASLSKDAVKLITDSAILDFFSSCGTYYIRSITRQSQFLTVFSYTSATRRRDVEFEQQLHNALQGFGMHARPNAGTAQADNEEFASRAEMRNLHLRSYLVGLGDDHEGNLVAFDMNAYKELLRKVYQATQNDQTGRVLTMEIVPWLSHPTFNALSRQNRGGTSSDMPISFLQRVTLSDNAEFYILLDDAIADLEDIMERGKRCQVTIERTYKRDGKLLPEYRDQHVVNRRTGELLPLAELNRAFGSQGVLAKLHDLRDKLIGTSDGLGEIPQCLSTISKRGVEKQSYREIDSCRGIEQQLPIVYPPIIDGYCMPELAKKRKQQLAQ